MGLTTNEFNLATETLRVLVLDSQSSLVYRALPECTGEWRHWRDILATMFADPQSVAALSIDECHTYYRALEGLVEKGFAVVTTLNRTPADYGLWFWRKAPHINSWDAELQRMRECERAHQAKHCNAGVQA